MVKNIRIGLVGDFNSQVLAHEAIPKALMLNAESRSIDLTWHWLDTINLDGDVAATIKSFDGIWCVPASPYQNMDGAIAAIRIARESNIPFLGTCGGYQHAVLEFARNVLGFDNADNAEVNADAEMPLVSSLICALVEQHGEIIFSSGSRISQLYGSDKVVEKYHCSYGINPAYLHIFTGSDFVVTGYDEQHDPRTFELLNHKFFIGTAYQPERSALSGQTHPVIQAFVAAAAA